MAYSLNGFMVGTHFAMVYMDADKCSAAAREAAERLETEVSVWFNPHTGASIFVPGRIEDHAQDVPRGFMYDGYQRPAYMEVE